MLEHAVSLGAPRGRLVGRRSGVCDQVERDQGALQPHWCPGCCGGRAGRGQLQLPEDTPDNLQKPFPKDMPKELREQLARDMPKELQEQLPDVMPDELQE